MLDLKKRRKMKREGVRRNERIHMQSLRVDACDSACFVFAAKLTSHMQPGRLLTFYSPPLTFPISMAAKDYNDCLLDSGIQQLRM
jgi:hypothetical protein